MGKDTDLTTIAVYPTTKDALDKLKIHPNQSYDELLQNMIKELRELRQKLKKA